VFKYDDTSCAYGVDILMFHAKEMLEGISIYLRFIYVSISIYVCVCVCVCVFVCRCMEMNKYRLFHIKKNYIDPCTA
jgi:hypothetical protein